MLPGNVLSTTPEPAGFIPPRDRPKVTPLQLVTDYSIGGNDLNDASAGLQTKIWTGTLSSAGISIHATGVGPYLICNDTGSTPAGITEFSFTFDQNMRYFVTYVVDGISKFKWFDTIAGMFVTTTLPEGSITPRASLDDPRRLQVQQSDIILAYVRGDSLFYRQQRDRYATERLLTSDLIDGQTVLVNVGMNEVYRFQFELSNGTDSMNCECETISTYRTLLQLRTSMMRRLGYAAQASNPPPGMADLLTEFLQDAQKQIYNMPNGSLRTDRFYKWTMDIGQRYYGLNDNDPACCDKHIDVRKVKWVGFEDLNGMWTPLIQGIPPEFYSMITQTQGWPSHYEIRSCLEIFPAPQAAYTLWVKGDFGLEAFTADTDRTTIDDEAVFLLALGNAKSHYGQRDAQNLLTQANNYISRLVAGTHMTARYIPQQRQVRYLTPPVMTHFDP